MPLFIADADSEGGIGFILQQSLYNQLIRLDKKFYVVSIVTQVVVDKTDPAFASPSKPVGPFFTEEYASSVSVIRDWIMKEDAGRGWRRVVPSPRPIRIIEADTIKRLAEGGDIVIAAGGGGVPVVEEANGLLKGIDAVIDKDLASSLLARQVGAERLIILTSVDCVYLDYGKPAQRPISKMGVSEAKYYLAQGQFAPGSMRPKIQAAIEFIEGGGKEVIITSPEMIKDAITAKAGTVIS
jgi:carbamate kinase